MLCFQANCSHTALHHSSLSIDTDSLGKPAVREIATHKTSRNITKQIAVVIRGLRYILDSKMIQILLAGLRTYAPWITFPFAVVIGAVGYTIERTVRKDGKQAVHVKSIAEEREERQLAESLDKDCTNVESLKEKKGIPKTVLDRNEVRR